MNQKSVAATVAAAALLTALSTSLWIHRVSVDRPVRHGFGSSDVFTLVYPNWVFVHNQLRQGNLPLWNPYQYAGQPFLGLHVPGLLYPPNLFLLALLKPRHALAAHAVIHIALAGIFTWLFCRRLGLGATARFAAAIAYMLSMPALQAIYMPPFFPSLVWLPGALWALHGLLTEARAKWAVALAACSTLAFLGGYVQGFVYMAQFLLAYAAFGLVCVTPRGKRARVASLAAVSGLLVVGFSGPQLLPAIELARQAVRGLGGLSLEQATAFSVTPHALLWGMLGRTSPVSPLFWSSTLPTLTIPLVVCGLMARGQRANWLFFLLAAIFAGSFMLGSSTPVFGLYHSLPLGNLFRVPRRIDLLYVFVVAVSIGLGVHAVQERLRVLAGGKFIPYLVALICLCVIGVESYSRTKLPFTHPFLGTSIDRAPTGLIEYMRRQPGRPRFFLEPNGATLMPRLSVKTGTMNELFVLPDNDPSMPNAYAKYFDVPERFFPWHARLSVLPYTKQTRHTRHQPRYLSAEDLGKLLDLMSVRHYAMWRPRLPAATRELQSFAGGTRVSVGPVEVVERPTALPRAYTVRRVLYEPEVESALARIKTDVFRPRQEAVVISPNREADRGDADASLADVAEITGYSTEEVAITAECHSACLLILTDLHYPGWRVFVDGREDEIQRVNVLFRGVWLDPGAHRIVYRYEPRSFRLGLWMLVSALLTAAALVFVDRPRTADLGSGARS